MFDAFNTSEETKEIETAQEDATVHQFIISIMRHLMPLTRM